ncbi:MFS transporter, CP family, cyanate transporter [Virgibacillus subterraneus]|uniref:MFS transporter, CP family, cyanate transporter n=1 Tax=Virgibacillus subterraneus TaxID=621109 RepID=A0A1H9BKQ9_9BACI|nr:MFS transporter [Virgibacillus subterraneus]SEP89505.1 MFS transporter, CP family, cyanate transporter [Virgibacillus subterraneus]
MSATDNQKNLYRFLLIAGIIIVAFNLRPAITSVGPLIGIIRDDVGLSNWSAGILTSLPLVAFAVMSPVAPKLGNRFSNERTLIAGLILLLFGITVRSFPFAALLFIGTLFVGLGIAICNVLLPGVVKEKFPTKVALMTSVYSTAMGIFAATASGLSIPFARGLNMGWQFALIIWTVPAIVGIIIWMYLSKKNKADNDVEMQYVTVSDNRMWKSPLAWQVACFMGLQSFMFYVTISWLPEILHDYGVSMGTAGWMLSFMQFIGLPASFFVPMIAGRFKSQRGIVLVMTTCALGGYGGLLIGKSYAVMVISTILIGITLSGSFALALAFLGMRARNSRQAAELSGMAQSLGYTLAAVGPMFIGYLYDVTHVWTVPLLTLIGVALLVMVFGMGAGRNRYVLD